MHSIAPKVIGQCPINITVTINLPSFADKVRAKRRSCIGMIRGDTLLIDREHYAICHYNAERSEFVCTNGVRTMFVREIDVYRGIVQRYRNGKRVKECPNFAFVAKDISTTDLLASENRVRAFRPAYMRGHQPDFNHD